MDFYLVLGVRRGASDGEIRRAYMRLARLYHPDLNPGDRQAATRFREIAMAYQTLVDPDLRRRYDRGDPAPVQAAAAGFTGFDFSPLVHAEPSTTFGDLFAQVLTAPLDDRPVRGADVHLDLTVSLDEVASGARRSVTVPRHAACGLCAGTGAARVAPVECAACGGAGATRVVRGHMMFSTPCPQCGGAGVRPAISCPGCDGRGVEARADAVTVDVPPGICDGAVLHVPGLGHVGRAGGAAGDAHVRVSVTAHSLYRRDGQDLHVEVPVALHEAALGTRLALPALNGGVVRLRVPPGTQSGQRFRLRERGLPSARGDAPGDLVAEIRLMLPAVLDERSKALLREFGALQPDSVRDRRFALGEDGV